MSQSLQEKAAMLMAAVEKDPSIIARIVVEELEQGGIRPMFVAEPSQKDCLMLPVKMKIASLDEATRILTSAKRAEYTHVISIGVSDHKALPLPCDLEALGMPYLRLEFHDVHFLSELEVGDRPPTVDDINWLIKCLRSVPADANVLFHCHMGISRSGAAALIYAYLRTGVELAAVQALLSTKKVRPNRLMLVIADAILGTKLVTACRAALYPHGQYLVGTNAEELAALRIK